MYLAESELKVYAYTKLVAIRHLIPSVLFYYLIKENIKVFQKNKVFSYNINTHVTKCFLESSGSFYYIKLIFTFLYKLWL